MSCDQCGAPAVVFAPGTKPVHELFLLARDVPMRCWCLAHARAAGWPWLAAEKRRAA